MQKSKDHNITLYKLDEGKIQNKIDPKFDGFLAYDIT